MGRTAIDTTSSSSSTARDLIEMHRKAEQFDRLMAAMRRYGVDSLEAALRYIDDPLFFDQVDIGTWARGLADADLNLDRLERALVREVVLHSASTLKDAARWLGIALPQLRAKLARYAGRGTWRAALARAPKMPAGWDNVDGRGRNLKGLREAATVEAIRRSGSKAAAARLLGVDIAVVE